MKISIRHHVFYWVLAVGLSFSACKESFDIQYEVQDTAPILVVEGYINAGATESRYELAYALPLHEEGDRYSANIPLLNALVTIESERGDRYNASSQGSGFYVIPHPMLALNQQYRLRIQTGQTEYLSAFVPVKTSSEIGEVEWERNEDGVQIYLNTADPSNSTRYYRWEYEDAWIYYSQVRSWFILDGTVIRRREPHEQIDKCYAVGRSSNIYLATSEELAEDVIHRFPLLSVPNLSEKLSERYSVLVRQVPLTAEAYTYWEQLRESSQNLGDLFGPMPSELRGNIACISNPDFHVIGMVEAVKVAEKRIYINRLDLPGVWTVDNDFFNNCALDTAKGGIEAATRHLIQNPNFEVVRELPGPENNPLPVGYLYTTSRRCMDCAFRGGKYTPPVFWQE